MQELPADRRRAGEPFGIVVGADGNIYVTGTSPRTSRAITPTGTYTFFAVGGEPWEIVNGPDGDFFITDRAEHAGPAVRQHRAARHDRRGRRR